MKINAFTTTISAIFALAVLQGNVISQNNNFDAPQNMGANLNTASDETGPVISPDGLSLYFSSNRPGGRGGTDVYVSQRAALGSAWGMPQNVGATINSSANDNITGISLDGLSMLINSSRPGGLGGPDLYLSTRKKANNDFGWNAPVNLGATVNSPFTDNSGNFFVDPKTGAVSLLFSSDRVAMNGVKLDFYQSTRLADGTFAAPTPINELNGEGAHFGSAIRPDGLEIFIGSSRPAGLNNPKFDIFVATRASTSEHWNAPVLVGGINNLEGDDRLPKLSADSAILYFNSNRAGGFGGFDLYSATRCSLYAVDSPCTVNKANADFDGDGRSDLSIFRPSEGNWYIFSRGNNTFKIQPFGNSGDKIVPGDYDGDGRTDFAVFRPSEGNWYYLQSATGGFSIVNWGIETDTPVPGDYDGDGRTDVAVYRSGAWYIVQSSNGQIVLRQFGISTDIPVVSPNPQ